MRQSQECRLIDGKGLPLPPKSPSSGFRDQTGSAGKLKPRAASRVDQQGRSILTDKCADCGGAGVGTAVLVGFEADRSHGRHRVLSIFGHLQLDSAHDPTLHFYFL